MNTVSKKKAIVGSLAGLVLVSGTALGGIAVANANSSNTPSSGTTQGEQDDQNETAVKGSISVPESTTEVPDAEESAQLAKLATVDATAAEAAATASVPGSTVIKTDLNDEDGFLVYDVDVKDGAGTVTEVTVDAGNVTVRAWRSQTTMATMAAMPSPPGTLRRPSFAASNRPEVRPP